MIFLIAIGLIGGAFVFTRDTLPVMILVACAIYFIGLVLYPYFWIMEKVGFSEFVDDSWRSLSGQTPGTVVGDCDEIQGMGIFWFLVVGILLLLAMFLLMITFLGVPVGLVWSIGALPFAFNGEIDGFKKGIGVLTVGLGALVLGGLNFRLIHFMYQQGMVCAS